MRDDFEQLFSIDQHQSSSTEGSEAIAEAAAMPSQKGCPRRWEACNSGDQLELERRPKPKIGDRHDLRKDRPQVTTVADF